MQNEGNPYKSMLQIHSVKLTARTLIVIGARKKTTPCFLLGFDPKKKIRSELLHRFMEGSKS